MLGDILELQKETSTIPSVGAASQLFVGRLSTELEKTSDQIAAVASTNQKSISVLARDVAAAKGEISATGAASQRQAADLQRKVDQTSNEVAALGQTVQQSVAAVAQQIATVQSDVSAVGNSAQQNFSQLFQMHEQNSQQISAVGTSSQNGLAGLSQAFKDALNVCAKADLELALDSGSAGENVTATSLNAAAAGTLKKNFRLKLVNGAGVVQTWANFDVILTGVVTAVDPDIDDPVVQMLNQAGVQARFNNGIIDIETIADTDEGATKTYAAADTYTATVQVNADDKLFNSITVTPFVKTYTVI